MTPPRLNIGPNDPRVTAEIDRRASIGIPIMSEWVKLRAHKMDAPTLDRNIRDFVRTDMAEQALHTTTPEKLILALAEVMTAPYSFPVLTPSLAHLQGILGLSNSYTTEDVQVALTRILGKP